jgi:predicted Zn-dependent protease
MAERLDPGLAEVQVSRAAMHYRHAEWGAMLQRSRRALALDSLRFEARLMEAAALLRLRRLDEATARIERLAADRPGEPSVESLWGQLLLLEGRSAEALTHLERAARWSRDDPSLSFALGQASLLAGRPPEARDAFARTVELDPRYYDAWLRLATACHLLGDSAGRERALERAAALPDARDGRAQALRREFERPAP